MCSAVLTRINRKGPIPWEADDLTLSRLYTCWAFESKHLSVSAQHWLMLIAFCEIIKMRDVICCAI